MNQQEKRRVEQIEKEIWRPLQKDDDYYSTRLRHEDYLIALNYNLKDSMKYFKG